MTLLAGFLLAYVLGAAEYWHFAYFYAHQMNDLYGYQNRLLQGHAPWLADQNRVLAPLLIEGVRRLFHVHYESAYQHFMCWMFIGTNLSALVLFRQCGLRLGQVVIGLLLTASVPLLLFNYWWYTWTNLEASLFLLAFAVDASEWRLGTKAAALGAIFVAMVLTKESCVFLPIWLFLRHATPEWMGRRRWKRILPAGAVCAAMFVFALVADGMLRRWLWVSGTIPDLPDGVPPHNLPHVFGTHLLFLDYPGQTLAYLGTNLLASVELKVPWPLFGGGHFTDWEQGAFDFFVAVGLSASGFVAAYRRRDPILVALALLSLAYLAVCFLLINIPESDKFMPVLAAGAYGFANSFSRGRTSEDLRHSPA